MLTGRLASNRVPSQSTGETNTLLDHPNDSAEHPGEPSCSPSTGPTTVMPIEEGNDEAVESAKRIQRLVRRMRIQIWAGTIIGFVLALGIGAAFIVVVS
jgi:high-affinity iron transporter